MPSEQRSNLRFKSALQEEWNSILFFRCQNYTATQRGLLRFEVEIRPSFRRRPPKPLRFSAGVLPR